MRSFQINLLLRAGILIATALVVSACSGEAQDFRSPRHSVIETGSISRGPPAVRQPGFVIVQAGDTLYRIARRSNVAAYDLMAFNDLASADIRVGQRLSIPPY